MGGRTNITMDTWRKLLLFQVHRSWIRRKFNL